MQQQPSSLDQSPSFNSYSSNNLISALNDIDIDISQNDTVSHSKQQHQIEEQSYNENSNHVPDEDDVSDDDDDEDSDDDFDFEFAVVRHDGGDLESSISAADEIFSNGQIRPLFPLSTTNSIDSSSDRDRNARVSDQEIRIPLRKLLINDPDFSPTTSCSSSEAAVDEDDVEIDALPPGTYCVWTPKNQEIMMRKKSKSAGESSSRRWRLREFLRRSSSDGTTSLVVVAPKKTDTSSSSATAAAKAVERKKTVAVVVRGGDAAVKEYMEKRAAERESDRRKTYLPYRREVVGLFGGVKL